MAAESETAAPPATTTPEGKITAGTTAPPTAPSATPPSDGAAAPWYERLPDGLKGEKTLHAFKDEAALASSYLELKKWQSGALKIPGKDATPAEVAAYHEKLGVPKDPAGYDLTPLKGLEIDPARAAQIMPVFHKLGLTNAQAVQLIADFGQVEQRWKAQEAEGYLTAHDALVDEWGELVYNRRVQQVQRLVRQYADADTVAWLDRTGATNHPGLFRMLYPIAAQFAEDGLIAGDEIGGTTAPDVAQRIERIREQMKKLDRGSPDYKRLLDELERQTQLEVELLKK